MKRFRWMVTIGLVATSPVSAGSDCNDLVVDPVRAFVDLDAGIDAGGISGNADGGRRARTGQHFLRFEVAAKAGARSCAILGEYFRLESTAAPSTLRTTSVSPRAGQTVEFTLVFRMPVEAKEIVLLAGQPGGNVKPFPITVSPISP